MLTLKTFNQTLKQKMTYIVKKKFKILKNQNFNKL